MELLFTKENYEEEFKNVLSEWELMDDSNSGILDEI